MRLGFIVTTNTGYPTPVWLAHTRKFVMKPLERAKKASASTHSTGRQSRGWFLPSHLEIKIHIDIAPLIPGR
jgi:hypothetical protein